MESATKSGYTCLTIDTDNDMTVKHVPAHIQERMKSYTKCPVTPESIEQKLLQAEQRRKEHLEQRFERMRQSEEDCRRANEYLGTVPPQSFSKQVIAKSLKPLQQEYGDIAKK